MNQRPAATSIRGAVLLALGCTLALAVTLPSTVAGSDSGWQVQLGPDSDLCPRYLADPRLPVFGLKALSFSDSEVPDAGDARFGNQIGGRFSVLRLHPTGQPDRGVQFDVDVGFTGQFLSFSQAPPQSGGGGSITFSLLTLCTVLLIGRWGKGGCYANFYRK